MIGREYSDDEKAALKQAIVAARGYWHPLHEGLMEMSPAFLEAYLDYQNAPFVSAHLEPKVREFIYIAIDGSVTHLYERGLKRHIEFALEKGASPDEILEVIQLVCGGAAHHTSQLGFPILAEALESDPARAVKTPRPLTDEESGVKQGHMDLTGAWPAGGDELYRHAPEFVSASLSYQSIPWKDGPLAPKVKHFIGLALAASPTTLNVAATRAHIDGALKHGATPGEISDVLQLASAISVHTCTYAIPALMDAVQAFEAKKKNRPEQAPAG